MRTGPQSITSGPKTEVIPSAEIMERALWCYIQGNLQTGNLLGMVQGFRRLRAINRKGTAFSGPVQGDHPALSVIRHVIGKPAFSLDYMREECGKYDGCIQIYEDFGNGFSESNSYYISDFHQLGKEYNFWIPCPKKG